MTKRFCLGLVLAFALSFIQTGSASVSVNDDITGKPTGGGSSGGTGLLELNGLTDDPQDFAVGTAGTDFAISSSTATHTFNLPDASASARGAITTGAQTIAGAKTFTGATTAVELAMKSNASAVSTGAASYFTGVADGSASFSGGSSATNGSNAVFYGGSHGSKAGDFELRDGSTVVMNYDKSVPKLILGIAATTGETRMNMDHMEWVTSSSTALPFIYRSVDTGGLVVSGGLDLGSGFIRMYGETHATKPGQIDLGTNLAGGANLNIFGNNAVITHPTTTSEYGILRSGAVGFIGLFGGVSAASGYIRAYGDTHATKPSVVEIGNTAGIALSLSAAGVVNAPLLTASRVLTLDGSKNIAASSVTTTTLGFLDASSSIQGQLNARLPLSGGTMSDSIAFTGNRWIGSPTANTFGLRSNNVDVILLSAANKAGVGAGITAATMLDVDGGFRMRPAAAVTDLTADNQTITVGDRSYIRITSDNGTATNRTFNLSQSANAGQVLVLEWADASDLGELVDDAAQGTAGNQRLSATWSPNQYDTLTLMSNGTDWVETARSAN